ncbi:NADP-dependent oxidoreductase [Nonomuraea zeae]|uniref:NADP-dependent oxidoreductase n=2 Tax=Nonomuraea zeae TaxID=1642303 RepID=A0A5S4GNF2_9ACTN|nr:NADP-dependent oxidoreductase [Nonomuraea zeae]
MLAVSQRAFGGPEVLKIIETGRPEPGPHEVLVRIKAAGVNPADWKIRSGQVHRAGRPPFTLGLDLSGVVEGVGEAVTRLRPGDAVFGNAFPPYGAYAEYAAVPDTWLSLMPPELDHVQAAALPTTALTAWQPLTHVASVTAGQRVLVHAAAGGVGHLAVQIAKARGAYVIGTAQAGKHAFLRQLGADELIDYTQTDFATAAHDIDVVLDPIAGDYGPRSLDTLAPGGTLIDVRGSGPDRGDVRKLAGERGLRFVEFGFTPSAADLEAIAGLVRAGTLRAAVETVLPLAQAARAHELSETGRVKGKIVLTVDEAA